MDTIINESEGLYRVPIIGFIVWEVPAQDNLKNSINISAIEFDCSIENTGSDAVRDYPVMKKEFNSQLLKILPAQENTYAVYKRDPKTGKRTFVRYEVNGVTDFFEALGVKWG